MTAGRWQGSIPMSKSRRLQPLVLNGTSEPGRQARHIAANARQPFAD